MDRGCRRVFYGIKFEIRGGGVKKAIPKKDILIKQTLKKEDYLELPMDDFFYEKMHDKIMQAVEKTEFKTEPKWHKARVFLERNAERYRSTSKKVLKVAVISLVTSIAIGFLGVSQRLYSDLQADRSLNNQGRIIQEARNNPQEWAEMAGNYQNENDFYAEILSRKNDLATMVEIDNVLTQSL